MNILVLLIISVIIFFIGAQFYGKAVARWLGVDDKHPTPAVTINDGKDYVPTKFNILFGHHFS